MLFPGGTALQDCRVGNAKFSCSDPVWRNIHSIFLFITFFLTKNLLVNFKMNFWSFHFLSMYSRYIYLCNINLLASYDRRIYDDLFSKELLSKL